MEENEIKPKVSVIIPVYNALEDVGLCLKSLVMNFNFSLGDICIINDCSNQETTSYLREFVEKNKKFELLENEMNLGFVKTCNKGMKIARGEIVVLLNSDTQIPKEFCERVIKCFQSDNTIGIASPISSCSADFCIAIQSGFTLDQMNMLLRKKHRATYPLITAAEGFCYCIRKKVIANQGYLDEIYGKGYCEETDFSYRAITNGWKNVLIDDLYVYHKRQASFGVAQRTELMNENSLIFKKRWGRFAKKYQAQHGLKNPVWEIEKQMFPKRKRDGLIYRNMFEYIFSVKNSQRKIHKIITIFGLKISVKRKILPLNHKVVYTCITGEYDNLIVPKYVNKNWDYICFTSNEKYLKQKKVGPWHIRPLVYEELDNTRDARWHKIMAHRILGKYDESIWVDSNIDILTPALFRTIKEKKESDILVPIHDQRNCIYDECKAVVERNKISQEEADTAEEFLKKNNMPRNYGLNETNIIYRKHNKDNIKNIMEEWFEYVKTVSKRDQLSFSYVLWKNNIRVQDISIDNARVDFINYKIYKHGTYKNNVNQCCIFSCRNENMHKVITICGIKLKLKIKKLKHPKISVIIPVYNAEKYLRKCLSSVVNQTLIDIEIICIDDGSTDSSSEILNEYAVKDERIVILTQENKGPANARQTGIDFAKGKYIGFIDSDDFIDENYYELLYKNAKKYNADISMTDNVLLYENGITKKKRCGVSTNTKIVTSNSYKAEIIITTGICWNKIYKRSFINKNNLIFMGLPPSDDNVFNATTVIKANKIAVTHSAKYYYVQSTNSIAHKIKDKKEFAIFDNYKYIDEWIDLQKYFSLVEKRYWQYVNNRRKIRDFQVFYDTMSEEFKDEFKNLAEQNLRLKDLIISLTSYPARINTINQAIESLLSQTLKAEKVILWLSDVRFPNLEKDLPTQLLVLKEKGLDICWYHQEHDIKPYNKLINTLKKYPDKIIITADDDVIYENDRVEKLYREYLAHPEYIHCHRAHRILFEKGNIVPYNRWDLRIEVANSSYNNFLTGVGLVLYPPGCFYKDVLREDLFMKLAPDADDIWFWAMAVLNGTKINIIKNNYRKLTYIEGSQETALWKTNVSENQNDIKIQNILNYYPKLLAKLDKRDYFYNSNWEKIFSMKNHYTYKVITICGIKLKFKTKEFIQKQQLENLEKELKCTQKELKCMQKELKSLQQNTLKLNQAPDITELAMLKTKYHWDDIKIPVIKNTFETVKELINTNKSIIRFGDGEFKIIEGMNIVFQTYNPVIAEKLKEIFKDDDENLMIGTPEPYYSHSIDLTEKSKNFILQWFPKWHKIIEKYYNYDRTYYSTHISQMFPEYAYYDFENHYNNLKQIWNNKKITIITGDRVYNNIEHNIFENASEISYIYGPTENAFDEYEELKTKLINTPKENILIFALGPAGKILAYDMYKMGYRVLDLGHLIKDYDFYRKSKTMTEADWDMQRKIFFHKD